MSLAWFCTLHRGIWPTRTVPTKESDLLAIVHIDEQADTIYISEH